MSSSKEVINVLMVSPTLQGHLNPTLNFAKRLASKGVHVTLAIPEELRQRFQNLHNQETNNFHHHSDKPSKIQLAYFSDGLSVDHDRSNDPAAFFASFETKGAENLSNLITHLKEHDRSFSCFIANPFMPWSVDVAVSHGIPCAMFWPQASALFSIYCRYVCKTNCFPDMENPNETLQLPSLPTLQVRELPSFLLPSCPPYHKKMVTDFEPILDKVKWILGASVYEFEEEIVNSMASLRPILTIGPLVSPYLLGQKESEDFDDLSVNLWRPEDSCLQWLNDKATSSVIYVAFGSLMELSQKQMDNIAIALKNTKKPFLWVIRPQKGGAELPQEFLEETKEKGLVVTWCPQANVLMHPAVACFVSHCGWNSTLEAVTAGVPIVALPNWSDQPTNAKLVEDVFKTGVRMRIGEEEAGVASAEEVERCITEVMEGPMAEEIKMRAVGLKEAARKAMLDGGSSDRNIIRFVTEISGKST
ncbi:hypothetical protein HN51_001051 [Arachis hypogaea]|uniref:Glycosyltransferase n=1 Tax=Arachis duranensis TaxID=130453 RepID=A0A6P4CRP7_ARADU|nr:UDP-glycosyltransferase 84B2 [Arachis duranensis]XP_025697595.1 UDP-glycosyltransferase 84B2 [Arachis hypogaea]QHO49094.1 UDP-glycosyltransferase [Arachis hypogaea]